MNGVKNGDYKGSFTFISQLGNSVIDYLLVPADSADSVVSFSVGSMLESCHQPICFTLEAPDLPYHKTKSPTLPTKARICYKWKVDKEDKIPLLALKNDSWFNSRWDSNVSQTGSVDLAYKIFCQWAKRIFRPMIIKCGSKTEPIKTTSSNSIRLKATKHLKRFKQSGQEEQLSKFLELKEKYKKQRLVEKEQNRIECIERVSIFRETNDWSELWKLLRKSLKPRSWVTPDISMENWVRHFDSVYNIKAPICLNEWSDLSGCSDEDALLDAIITPEEICMSLKEMKYNKAPGHDSLPIDLFKKSLGIVLPPLVMLGCLITCWINPSSLSIGRKALYYQFIKERDARTIQIITVVFRCSPVSANYLLNS